MPMQYALKAGLEIDVFCIYTDSETWSGKIHLSQALQLYRQKTGIPAKLVVVGMTSNGFTIADPKDAGMMDVVGFDPVTPQAINEFAKLS
jgi:60 kDa SS-A/Ro ribonucleoprotein